MQREPHWINISALLWAIFLAEGGCTAAVPFGYLPAKDAWQKGQASFDRVRGMVLTELRSEYRKWRNAWASGKWPREDVKEKDFIRWLARVGYNANPKEWEGWERNVRWIYEDFIKNQARFDELAAQTTKKKD